MNPTGRVYTEVSSGINALDATGDVQRSLSFVQQVRGDAQGETSVFQATYPYGSLFDVAFSLLGLSNGYAYDAAQQALNQGLTAGDTLNFIGHSGGAQRVAVESRILGDYGIYGNAFLGIAGPQFPQGNSGNPADKPYFDYIKSFLSLYGSPPD